MLGLRTTTKLGALFIKAHPPPPKNKFYKATGPFLSQTHSLKLIELAAVNLVHRVIN